MNDLQINVQLNECSIITNVEELKEKLSAKMAEYENAIFTEESRQIAKDELASLRKLRESVERRRKEVKNQIMLPYELFNEEVQELVAIIDKPIILIDTQLKEMEEERIRKKRTDIRLLYEEVVGDFSEYLPYDTIYDRKWDNAGTSMKKIRESIEKMSSAVQSELSILQNSISDVKGEAIELYKRTRNLSKALEHINTYENNKKKILEMEEEKRRREEERRRLAEEEKIREEERKRLRSMEAARQEERRRIAQETEAKATEGIPVPFQAEEDILPFTSPKTVTAFYRVVATPEELTQVEMVFDSIGVFFERRDA